MDRPKIEVRGLRYGAGGTEILTGIDASIPDGEVTAVVGPSGAGKSTLLRAINRLIEPSSGEVYLDGEPAGSLDPLVLRRRVGMVFQIPALFGGSVEEAVLYGARLSGKDADPGRLLEMVGLDASLAGRDPQQSPSGISSVSPLPVPSPSSRRRSCSTNPQALSTRQRGAGSRNSSGT